MSSVFNCCSRKLVHDWHHVNNEKLHSTSATKLSPLNIISMDPFHNIQPILSTILREKIYSNKFTPKVRQKWQTHNKCDGAFLVRSIWVLPSRQLWPHPLEQHNWPLSQSLSNRHSSTQMPPTSLESDGQISSGENSKVLSTIKYKKNRYKKLHQNFKKKKLSRSVWFWCGA